MLVFIDSALLRKANSLSWPLESSSTGAMTFWGAGTTDPKTGKKDNADCSLKRFLGSWKSSYSWKLYLSISFSFTTSFSSYVLYTLWTNFNTLCPVNCQLLHSDPPSNYVFIQFKVLHLNRTTLMKTWVVTWLGCYAVIDYIMQNQQWRKIKGSQEKVKFTHLWAFLKISFWGSVKLQLSVDGRPKCRKKDVTMCVVSASALLVSSAPILQHPPNPRQFPPTEHPSLTLGSALTSLSQPC